MHDPAEDRKSGAVRGEALRRLLNMLGSRPAGGAPPAGYRPWVAEAAELADQLRDGLSEAVAGLSKRHPAAKDVWAPRRPVLAPGGQTHCSSS